MIRSFIDPDRSRFVNELGELTLGGKIWGLFEYNSWFYAILYLILIIAFNYFYVAIQYNPLEMANNLRKNNGAIPGIRPGKPTSDFITRIISKITWVGALFVALIAILPIILGNAASMNIALGGTSIIIVVGVALDTVRQLESQMMMRHYKGFLE
jgi:preprotein translocase subunit SecY